MRDPLSTDALKTAAVDAPNFGALITAYIGLLTAQSPVPAKVSKVLFMLQQNEVISFIVDSGRPEWSESEFTAYLHTLDLSENILKELVTLTNFKFDMLCAVSDADRSPLRLTRKAVRDLRHQDLYDRLYPAVIEGAPI